MDWEDISKFADACIDKKLESLTKFAQGNKFQLNKLISIVDTLEKHLELQSKALGPKVKPQTKPPTNLSPHNTLTARKSESKLKSPIDTKRKVEPEAEETKTLKKEESKRVIKKSVDVTADKKAEVNAKDEAAKKKKPADQKTEDSTTKKEDSKRTVKKSVDATAEKAEALKKEEDLKKNKEKEAEEKKIKKDETKRTIKKSVDVAEGKIEANKKEEIKKGKEQEPEEKKIKTAESQKTIKKTGETAEAKAESLKKEEELKKSKEQEAEEKKAKKEGIKKTVKKASDTPAEVNEEGPEEPNKQKKIPQVKNEPKASKIGKDPKKPQDKPKPEKKETEGSDKGGEEPIVYEEIVEIKGPSLVPKITTFNKEELEKFISEIKDFSHSKSDENFVPSIGLQISLNSLSNYSASKFYIHKNNPPAAFLWVFNVICQFRGICLEKNDAKIWEELRKFLTCENGTRILPNVGEKFVQIAEEFDFSIENLEKVEEIVSGVELDERKFAEVCDVSAVLLNLIKEATLFGGAILPDGPGWRVKARCEAKLSKLANFN